MSTWTNAWNMIIRRVIFPDSELKTLMLLPENTDIIKFEDKYFIRAGYTNKLVENEDVRITYSDGIGSGTDVPNVMRKMITFDIYVKLKNLHNVDSDRLLLRTQVIANRLIQLLTKSQFVKDTGYKFRIAGDWDLGTRTTGYARYCVAFYYMKVY